MIAVAVAASLALPMTVTNAADTTVYGKLHLSLSKYDEIGSAKDNWLLESNASRLGFKGKVKLDDGLTGTYKFESEIDVESGATSFATRNTYLGLKGGFGEVRFGQHDSPLKMSQGKFDQFGDTVGDLKYAGDEDGENRKKNSITYLGKFDKIALNVQLVPGEGNGTTAGQGIADETSVAIGYKSGPLYVAIAHDSHDKKVGVETDMTRLVATYKVNDMQFGLLTQSGVEAAKTNADKESWLGLSFNMKVGSKNKFKAQYITVKDNAASVLKGTHFTVGFDHKLGKKGTVYALYNTIKEENTAVTKDNKILSVGYVLKF